MALEGEAKKAYQRELMRKRRSNSGSNAVGSNAVGLTEEKPVGKTLMEVLVGPDWDKAKYPVKAAWEVACERAERARRYAAKFPHLIQPRDEVFQDVGWQYENEGIKRFPK
jgi:hypothetical protein